MQCLKRKCDNKTIFLSLLITLVIGAPSEGLTKLNLFFSSGTENRELIFLDQLAFKPKYHLPELVKLAFG